MRRRFIILFCVLMNVVFLLNGCGMSEEEKAEQAKQEQAKKELEKAEAFNWDAVEWGEGPLKNDKDYKCYYYGLYKDQFGIDRLALAFNADMVIDLGLTDAEPTDEELWWLSYRATDWDACGYSFSIEEVWESIHSDPCIDLTQNIHKLPDIGKIWENLGLSVKDETQSEIDVTNTNSDADESSNLNEDVSQVNDTEYDLVKDIDEGISGVSYYDVIWGEHTDDYIEYEFINNSGCYYGVVTIEESSSDIFLFYPEQMKEFLNLSEVPTDKDAYYFSWMVSMYINSYDMESVFDDPGNKEELEQNQIETYNDFFKYVYDNAILSSEYFADLPEEDYALPDEEWIISQYTENANKQMGIIIEPGLSFDLSFLGYADGSGTPYKVSIESITVTNVEDHDNSRYISVLLIGVSDKDYYPTLKISCYDEDGYLLGEESLILDVNANDKFKLDKTIFAPLNTTKILFHL